MKIRTTTIAALFFLVLGFTPLLFTILFHVKRNSIRDQMREKMETSVTFATVIIPVDEVVWMDDHEIWVEEQMFDIYSKELKDGKYIFKGHFDKAETKLVLAKRKSDKEHQKEKKLLVKFLQYLPNAFDEKVNDSFPWIFTNLNNYCSYTVDLVDHVKKIPTPPPETAHSI